MPRPPSHLPIGQFSIGRQSSFAENFEAMFRKQRDVDSAFGFEFDLDTALRENLSLAQQVMGEPFEYSGGMDALKAATHRELGQSPYDRSFTMILGKDEVDAALEELDKIDERLLEAQKLNPNIKTFKQVFQDQLELRRKLLADAELASTRATLAGQLGGLFGGITGSFDPKRDPLLFGSLFIPLGASRSVASRILREMAIGAGAETAQQGLFVDPRRRAFGEPSEFMQSVLFAGLGAAAFRGAFESLPFIGRQAERFVPRAAQRAAGREALRIVEEGEVPPTPPRTEPFDVLKTRIEEELPAGRERDETVSRLEVDERAIRLSPYDDSRAGFLLAQAEVEQFAREVEGLPDANLPFDFLSPEVRTLSEASPAEVNARQSAPELYTRIDEVEEELAALQTEHSQLQENLRNPSLGRAVGEFLDEEAGAKLREIESRFPEQGTARGVAIPKTIQEEINETVDRLGGPNAVLDALEDYVRSLRAGIVNNRRIAEPLRNELQDLQRQAGRLETEVAARPAPTSPQAVAPTAALSPTIRATMPGKLSYLEEFDSEVLTEDFTTIAFPSMTREGPEVESFGRADLDGMFKEGDGPLDLKAFGSWWRQTISHALTRGDRVTVTIGGQERLIKSIGKNGAVDENGKQVGTLSIVNDPQSRIEIERVGAIGAPAPVAATAPTSITKSMETKLRNLGFTDETLEGMKPDEAWTILNRIGVHLPEKQAETVDVGLDRPVLRRAPVAEEEKVQTMWEVLNDMQDDDAMAKATIACGTGGGGTT